MKKLVLFAILLVALTVSACATAAPAPTEVKSPTVTLKQVQVASYFPAPWTGWPAAVPTPTPPAAGTPAAQYVPFPGSISVPLIVAFIWEIDNPNEVAVKLEQMKYTVEFEAAPSKAGEYFALSTAIVNEKMSVPAKTKNELRVTTVLDSAVVPGNLAVTSGQRLGALGLSGATLVKDWWANVGDTGKFGIKATGGTADFSGGGKSQLVTFDGKFPK